MEYKIREYPLFAACGLNCGLCPRYYTAGTSRCPGCAGEGFSEVHPTCGILSCCQRKGIEYCFECEEFPCKKYATAKTKMTDSFITHRNQLTDMEKAKQIGIEAYKAELNNKVELLEELLHNYDDGRRKSFYCLAVSLLELQDIKIIMNRIKEEVPHDSALKEKAKACATIFEGVAKQRGISLKLRR